MRLRALIAAVALAATASANDEITLIPAQPVAPTRTQLMEMEAAASDAGGGPVVAPGVTDGSRRRIIDGSYLRSLHAVRCRFRQGVDMSIRCSCWAAELTFMFGGCSAYFTPKWECTSCSPLGCGRFGPIHYGPGSTGTAPTCHDPVTPFPVSR